MTTPYFGAKSKLWYIEEVTTGVTPASPVFKPLRYTSDTLALAKETLQSAELDGEREINAIRTSANQVNGAVSTELSHSSHDDLLEAALQGTWTADVLKVGTIERSFTIMRETLDSDSVQHFDIFTGCRITGFSMSTTVNALVTVEYQVLGENAAYDAAEPTGATYQPATTTEPYIFVDGTLSIDNTPYALVSGVTQSNDNAASANFALGSNFLAYVGFGRANNTLTLDGAFYDYALVNAFESEDFVDVKLNLELSGDSLQFHYPRCKLTGGPPTVAGEDAITYSAGVQAIKDATAGTSLAITRATTP